MKRLLTGFGVIICMVMAVAVSLAMADRNPTNSVCGNSYTLTIGGQLYLAVFPTSAFGPSCEGTMTIYWSNQSRGYAFSTYENIFTNIQGVGNFVLEDKELYYLNPNDIVLTQIGG